MPDINSTFRTKSELGINSRYGVIATDYLELLKNSNLNISMDWEYMPTSAQPHGDDSQSQITSNLFRAQNPAPNKTLSWAGFQSELKPHLLYSTF